MIRPTCNKTINTVLVHGFPQGNDMWHPLKTFLHSKVQVHLLRLKGYQGPLLRQQAFSIKALVADLAREICRTTDQPVVFVGHDWGGFLGWYLAAKYPLLLKHLVTINAPHPTILKQQLRCNDDQQKASAYIKELIKPGAAIKLSETNYKLLDQLYCDYALKKGLILESTKENYHRAWARPGAMQNMLAYYQSSFVSDEEDRIQLNPNMTIPIIKVPTTVIWGKRDPAFVPQCFDHKQLEKVIDGPCYKIEYAHSHWCPEENPSAIADDINRLILEDSL